MCVAQEAAYNPFWKFDEIDMMLGGKYREQIRRPVGVCAEERQPVIQAVVR
jgi:hypothetical protein